MAGAALLLIPACGGGGGGGGTPAAAAPSGLAYQTNPLTATVGSAISPDPPSSSGGAVTSYSVQPSLPPGLSLDPGTGVVSGTPTTAANLSGSFTVTASNSAGSTQATLTVTVAPPAISAFSVGSDLALSYPSSSASPPYLVDLPDEHTTFLPTGDADGDYLVFGASRINTIPTGGGAVVLQTSDFSTFQFAAGLGYSPQVMAPPVSFTQCQTVYNGEFDENYSAPGSVVQDPTLPAGNLIMLYEAENHCPGGVNQTAFYATVGFARSTDNGKTWPAPENGTLGGANRFPVLAPPNAQPQTATTRAMGDCLPSGFVDTLDPQGPYLYVVYDFDAGGVAPLSDGKLRVARAKLGGSGPLSFSKWYQTGSGPGGFTQPGISGLDSGVLPGLGCTGGFQTMGEISYNDDLGVYLMVYMCQGTTTGAWYYATATSLALQDWSQPQLIQGSQMPVTSPCSAQSGGSSFDGYYPSLVSPGAAAGHTRLTGKVFFLDGCDQGARTFVGRNFTITLGAAPAAARALPDPGPRQSRVWRVADAHVPVPQDRAAP